MTDEGRRMTQLSEDARSAAQNWLKDVEKWEWDKAYLETLPPAERKELEGKKEKDWDAKHQAGRDALRQGDKVHADPAVFWAPLKKKDEIISIVRGIFGKGKTPEGLNLQPSAPIYHRDAERVTFRFDLTLPEYGVQSQVVVTADARNGDPTPADWRVESLELISGKTLTPGAVGSGGSPATMPRRPH
jgi:hypothetical protein